MTDPEPADTLDSARETPRLQMRRVARMFASWQGQLIRETVAEAQEGVSVLTPCSRKRRH